MLSSPSRQCLVRAPSFLTLGKRGRLGRSRRCKISRTAKRRSCLLRAMDWSWLLRIGMTGRLGGVPLREVPHLGTEIARTTIKPRSPDDSGLISNNPRPAYLLGSHPSAASFKSICGKHNFVGEFADRVSSLRAPFGVMAAGTPR